MRRFWVWFLLVWVIGIILPLDAILRRYWPPAHDFFERIFEPEWVHVVSHALLFGILAILLAALLERISPTRQALLILLAVLIFAAGQEGFQLVTRHRLPDLRELFDLMVDLVSAALGWFLYHRIKPRRVTPVHP